MGKRRKIKGRRSNAPFVMFRCDVWRESDVCKSLSFPAIRLLVNLTMQFNGSNNGNLSMGWKYMKRNGWRSPDTLNRAKRELVDKGLIELTRQGGLGRCSLFAVTWWAIDDCNGKPDVGATKAPRNWWKDGKPPDKDDEKQSDQDDEKPPDRNNVLPLAEAAN